MNTTTYTQDVPVNTQIKTSADVPLLEKTETLDVKNATAPGANWEAPKDSVAQVTTSVSTSVDTPMLVKEETVSRTLPDGKQEVVLPPITLSAPKIAVVKKESVPQLGSKKGSYNEYTLEVSTDKSRHEVKRRVKDFKDLFNELGKTNPQLEIPESIKQLLSPEKIKESLESVGHNVSAGLSTAGEKVAEVTQPIREISSNAANNVASAGQNVASAGSSVLSAIGQNVQTAGSKIIHDISEGVKQHSNVASQTVNNISADLKEATTGIKAEVNVQKEVVADTAEVAKIDAKAAATDLKNEVWKQAEIAVENTKQAVSDINAQLSSQVKATAESTKQAVAELPFVVSDQVKKTKEERIPALTQYLQSLVAHPQIGASPPIKRFLSLDNPPSYVDEEKDWKETDMPWLNQKLAIVTGASSGIGWACTKAMAAKGCHVIMAVRNLEKAHAKLEELKKTMTNPYIEIMHLDTTRPDSIQTFAKDFQLKYRHLDILINNAGVFGLPETRTADGKELHMATNHFGHFALTGLLLDCLARADHARIVTVGSIAHKGGKLDFDDLNAEKKTYSRWQQYQQAALANVVFAFELQRKLNEKRIDNVISVAAHPGFANTHALQLGPEMEGSWFGKALASVTTAIAAQSPEMGALPILYAATSPRVKGGDYCGPKGFNHLRGYPTIHFADDNAYDASNAARLWTAATAATGIQYDFDSAAKSRLSAQTVVSSTPTPISVQAQQPLVHT